MRQAPNIQISRSPMRQLPRSVRARGRRLGMSHSLRFQWGRRSAKVAPTVLPRVIPIKPAAAVTRSAPPAKTTSSVLPTLPSAASTSASPSTSASASASASASKPPGTNVCCDKCDGKHETENCPYYKKKRDDHPDAQRRAGKQIGGTSLLPGAFLPVARVVRQPGDGSCLFHSICYGYNNARIGGSHSAQSLRSLVSQFITSNSKTKINDTPVEDWVKWDSNCTVDEYSRRIARGGWGGGIEMACLSTLLMCNIHVYERRAVGFQRISAFDCPSLDSRPTVRVLYCGGVHYDALG